jgi:hypothetical protein
MKRQLVPVLLWALILPALVLTGCPQDSGDSTPGGNLGDGNLVLEGTVYKNTSTDPFSVTYEKYTTDETIEAYTYGSPTKLGDASLLTGEFSLTVKKPDAASLMAFDAAQASQQFDAWKNPTVDPADVKGAMLYLQTANGDSIEKKESHGSGNETSVKGGSEYVTYLYVDKDVTFTREENEGSGTYEGLSATYRAKKAVLKLEAGWNALYFEQEGEMSTTSAKSTSSVSVGNPKLRWVWSQNQGGN